MNLLFGANVFAILKVAADKLELSVADKSVQTELSVDPCNLKVFVVTVFEKDHPDGTSISRLEIVTGYTAATFKISFPIQF